MDAPTPIKILIADDDPPTLIMLRAAISQWGYEVIEAKNGEEAWKILQQPDAPHLLILDWLMPGLDGITLCSRVKQQPSSMQSFIILLTQMTGTTNTLKGLEAGADEFLSKPFNMAELRSRLSVGARIIQLQNALLEKTLQIKKISDSLSTLSNTLDTFMNTSGITMEKLQPVKNSLQDVVSLTTVKGN